MSISRIPESYTCRGKNFSNLADAEFYEVSQAIQDYIKMSPHIVEKDVSILGLVIVNQVFNMCEVKLRRKQAGHYPTV